MLKFAALIESARDELNEDIKQVDCAYYMPPVLHSLNSLCVLAKFCVVHVHVAGPIISAINTAGSPLLRFVKENVMSFFFVLSGFVMAYSHAVEDGEERRLRSPLTAWSTLGGAWERRFSQGPFSSPVSSTSLVLPSRSTSLDAVSSGLPAPSSFSCCRLERASLTSHG